MKQSLTDGITLAVRTQAQGIPTLGSDGTGMSVFGTQIAGPVFLPKRYLIESSVAGAGTAMLTLWALSSFGTWGRPVDTNGNLGAVAGAQALAAGVYPMIFEDVGIFSRICLVQSGNAGGTPVITAKIFGIVEVGESQ